MSEHEQIITTKGLTGYKSLQLSQNTLFMLSMTNDFVWEPGKSVVAHCPDCGNEPKVNCTCGIYAHKDLKYHMATGYNHIRLPIVELELWGVIHQFTDGYRAQYAKIVKIFLPQHEETVPLAARRDALELAYMVPVEYIEMPKLGVHDIAPYVPRPKALTIEDFELFIYSDDKDIADFCRRELKKRYYQKITSLKNRIKYANNVLDDATTRLAEIENKRARLMQ